ncbi:MAG: FtsX-like permease family protein [Actinomycetota bacterium]
MSAIARGGKNAFRNVIRTLSIIMIVGLSIGLALVMVLSLKAVQARIDSVKSQIGNNITISPAGARGFEGGGEPLTQTELKPIAFAAHVAKTTYTLSDRARTDDTISLTASIDMGTLGNRQRNFTNSNSGQTQQPPPDMGDRQSQSGGTATTTRSFTMPIMITGSSDLTTASVAGGSQFKITSGKAPSGTSGAIVALIGKSLAAKNNLKVGSTFTLYGTTVKVAGIYDAGNTFANGGIVMPLKTLQTLSGKPGEISSASVQVDSITNVDAVAKTAKTKLGTKADIVTPTDTSSSALAPLENIKTIATYSLIGALVAGAVIILLTMLMIVRERRREIGVLKAIGSSNMSIVTQFVTESTVLTLLGSAFGAVLGVFLSNPILNVMVNNSQSTAAQAAAPGAGGGPGAMRVAFMSGPGLRSALQNIQANVGFDLLLYGLLAAIVIAVIGSAIPAWMSARIRPAEAMRSE